MKYFYQFLQYPSTLLRSLLSFFDYLYFRNSINSTHLESEKKRLNTWLILRFHLRWIQTYKYKYSRNKLKNRKRIGHRSRVSPYLWMDDNIKPRRNGNETQWHGWFQRVQIGGREKLNGGTGTLEDPCASHDMAAPGCGAGRRCVLHHRRGQSGHNRTRCWNSFR